MATVANLGFIGDPTFPVDKPLCLQNRTNAGEPNGSITPQFSGEIVLDTTNNNLWKAVGIANNTWVALTPVS
jgi:hypothetical protein